MKLIDFTDPFYAPVWIRACIVIVCIGWGLIELAGGEYVWAVGFVSVGLLAVWRFSVIDYGADPEE